MAESFALVDGSTGFGDLVGDDESASFLVATEQQVQADLDQTAVDSEKDFFLTRPQPEQTYQRRVCFLSGSSGSGS